MQYIPQLYVTHILGLNYIIAWIKGHGYLIISWFILVSIHLLSLGYVGLFGAQNIVFAMHDIGILVACI